MGGKNFNKNHPERLDDEVFITNATDKFDFEEHRSSYDAVGWKTKRRGDVSYDIDGKPLGQRWPGSFPVFAKIAEIEKSENGKEILKRLLP
ncbi:MAG: hypothetical protein H6791_01570 [Candidatus Nomurabacteria bacterium]|nr:MAG: hypothetical protein H6791_01570 [Candidatus Nomurabacteria bacterium]